MSAIGVVSIVTSERGMSWAFQCGSTVSVKPYFFYGQGTVNACEKCIKAYEDEIWAAGF